MKYNGKGGYLLAGLIVLMILANVLKSYNKKRDFAAETDKRNYGTAEAVPEKPAVPFEDELSYYGKILGMKLIKQLQPGMIEVGDQVAGTVWKNDSSYAGKWVVTGVNGYGMTVRAYAMASVKYKGGEIRQPDNWEVLACRIIEP